MAKQQRRGRGEGTIYPIVDKATGTIKRYAAALTLGYDGTGRRLRRTIYGATKQACAAKLNVARRQHEQGVDLSAAATTVAAFLQIWLDTVVAANNRPRTLAGYTGAVTRYLVPQLGRHPLPQLSAAHVQAMLAALQAQGLGPASVRYAYNVLKRALNVAVRWGDLPRNPAALIKAPHVPAAERTVLTIAQARQLLTAVKGNRWEALYRVLLSLGLRRGAILGLRWQDVDLERGTLRITGALQRINHKLERTAPKTARSARVLPLPATVVAALRQHAERQLMQRARLAARWHDHDLVFPATYGTPMEPGNLNRHFAKLLKRAGLPRTRVHDLRHACASALVAEGIHPKVISQILGHASIDITMNLYAHVFDETQRDATAKLDAHFSDG